MAPRSASFDGASPRPPAARPAGGHGRGPLRDASGAEAPQHQGGPASPGDRRVPVVGLGISLLTLDAATEQVLQWSAEPVGRYVCAANVHMVMEAHDSPAFRDVVSAAGLVLPDGMPLVFAQRLLGHRGASRARGVEITERLLERAALAGVPVAFYGGTPRTQGLLLEAARRRFPGLRVAAAISPPFRAATPEEDERDVRAIVDSGARILLVGIGCPRQERWMAAHVARLACVMVGVGQAFDLLAGVVDEAPRWMHGLGLSWLHRLAQEPRRLFWRYARHNPRFVALLALQVLRHRLVPRRPAARLVGM